VAFNADCTEANERISIMELSLLLALAPTTSLDVSGPLYDMNFANLRIHSSIILHVVVDHAVGDSSTLVTTTSTFGLHESMHQLPDSMMVCVFTMALPGGKISKKFLLLAK